MKRLLTLLTSIAIGAAAIVAQALPTTNHVRIQRKVEFSNGSVTENATQRFRTACNTPTAKPFTPRHQNAPGEIAEPGTIYGYLGMAGNGEPIGFYNIKTNGLYTTLWADPLSMLVTGQAMVAGWYNDNKVCGYSAVTTNEGALVLRVEYVEYDFALGDVLKQEVIPDNKLFYNAIYNESDGFIYGYGTCDEGFAFMRAPMSNPLDISIVKNVTVYEEICQSLAYCPVDNGIYGITTGGKFVKVNRIGEQEELFPLDSRLTFTYVTGLAYSLTDNLFYWNMVGIDGSSSLYAISATEKSARPVADYISQEQFLFMFAINEEYYADAPAKPVYVKNTFDKGSLSGMVSFRLPSRLNDGSNISASTMIDWTIALDGKQYGSGKGKPNSYAEINFENLTEGIHTFTIRPSIGNRTGLSVPVSLYIGNDVPSAPRNVVLDKEGNLKWDAVTTGASGGYVDPEAIVYSVYFLGKETETTSATSSKVNLPTDAPLNTYFATVAATFKSKTSDATPSNIVICGNPLTLDVELTPTYSQSDLFTILDNNGDGHSWTFLPFDEQGACFYSDYSKTERMDDWLFLPVISFDDAKAFYSFEMQAKYFQLQYPDEFVEVRFGTEPTAEAMTGEVMELTRIIEPDYTTYGGKFRVPAAGAYYIGIHSMSNADMAGVYVKNFSVKKSAISDQSPAAVTDLEAETETGFMYPRATVKFRLPNKTMGGADIPASSTVTAYVSALSNDTVAGAPGSLQTAVVDLREGVNRITVTTAIGSIPGDVAWKSLFIGNTIPEPVDNLTGVVSDDMMSIRLNWLAPVQDANNVTLDPSTVTYNIYILGQDGWEMIDGGITETTYTYSLPSGTMQTAVQLGVQAENSAGANNKLKVHMVALGKPQNLPMIDEFTNLQRLMPGYAYYIPADNYVANWDFTKSAELPDCPSDKGYALTCFSQRAGQKARFSLPAFSTRGIKEATFTATLWTGSNSPLISFLYESASSQTLKTLYLVERTGRWENIEIVLPNDAQNNGWARIYIECDMDAANQIFALDKYSVAISSASESISAENAAPAIEAIEGGIRISGGEGVRLVIATPDGRIVTTRTNIPSELTVETAPGLYIVKAGETTAKIAVR